jgi:hypothetical protein
MHERVDPPFDALLPGRVFFKVFIYGIHKFSNQWINLGFEFGIRGLANA